MKASEAADVGSVPKGTVALETSDWGEAKTSAASGLPGPFSVQDVWAKAFISSARIHEEPSEVKSSCALWVRRAGPVPFVERACDEDRRPRL